MRESHSSPGLAFASTLNDWNYSNFHVSIAANVHMLDHPFKTALGFENHFVKAEACAHDATPHRFLYWHLLSSINSHSHPRDFLAPLAVAPTPFLHVPETAVGGVRVSWSCFPAFDDEKRRVMLRKGSVSASMHVIAIVNWKPAFL